MERISDLNRLSSQLEGLDEAGSIAHLASLYPGKIIFTTSFGIEDQVITHLIFSNDIRVEVITLDTGRLFNETYKVFSATRSRYGKEIKVFFPRKEEVEKMVSAKGPFSFYESKENRLECCRIRKVEPLNRALEGMEIWITGIRAEQSENRTGMSRLEVDDKRNIIKFHPLSDWTLQDVEDYLKKYNIPYNPLHHKGFVSIGCEPCTRAVQPGEDFRSGRWWWENDGKKECGLHIK